jgi:hypothetical protein
MSSIHGICENLDVPGLKGLTPMDVLGGCKYCIISAKANLYKAALSLHVI